MSAPSRACPGAASPWRWTRTRNGSGRSARRIPGLRCEQDPWAALDDPADRRRGGRDPVEHPLPARPGRPGSRASTCCARSRCARPPRRPRSWSSWPRPASGCSWSGTSSCSTPASSASATWSATASWDGCTTCRRPGPTWARSATTPTPPTTWPPTTSPSSTGSPAPSRWPVSATGAAFLQPDIEDVVFISLRYPGKVAASVQASWLDPKKVRQITVVGSDRMATWDDLQLTAPMAIFDKGARARSRVRRLRRVPAHVHLGGRHPAAQGGLRGAAEGAGAPVPPRPGARAGSSAPTARFAIGVVKTLEAVAASIRSGGSHPGGGAVSSPAVRVPFFDAAAQQRSVRAEVLAAVAGGAGGGPLHPRPPGGASSSGPSPSLSGWPTPSG